MSETALTAEREYPEPKYKILRKELETVKDDLQVHQWLVETQHKHVVRIVEPPEDGKVKPPRYGKTNHVLVTTRWERVQDGVEYAETTVYASNEEGNFFPAALYVTNSVREVWEAMFAIGEI